MMFNANFVNHDSKTYSTLIEFIDLLSKHLLNIKIIRLHVVSMISNTWHILHTFAYDNQKSTKVEQISSLLLLKRVSFGVMKD